MAHPAKTGDPYAPWWTHNLVVFDVETTGLDDHEDRVVEVGFARFEQGNLVDAWGTLVFPNREVPDEATEVHGISTLDVATAPPFVAVVGEALRISRNCYPVAYNAEFDRRFFRNELARLPFPREMKTPIFDDEVLWLDPLVWARRADGVWGNKLTQACDRYGVILTDAHRATDDATAAGRLLFEGLKRTMPNVTMTELLRRQVHYAKLQKGTLRAWFKQKGLPFDE